MTISILPKNRPFGDFPVSSNGTKLLRQCGCASRYLHNLLQRLLALLNGIYHLCLYYCPYIRFALCFRFLREAHHEHIPHDKYGYNQNYNNNVFCVLHIYDTYYKGINRPFDVFDIISLNPLINYALAKTASIKRWFWLAPLTR